MAKTIEEIVKEGVDERILRNIAQRYSGPDGHKLNPFEIYVGAIGADMNDPLIKATYIASRSWPSPDKAAWIDSTYAKEAGELVSAVQSNVAETIRGIDKPDYLVSLIIENKPSDNGDFSDKHRSAYEALELDKKLIDPQLADKIVGDYMSSALKDLASRTNRNVVSAVEFAFKRSPQLAINSMKQAAQQSLTEFQKKIDEDVPGAQEYLGSLYESLDDKKKSGLALKMGQSLTDIKSPLK